MFLHIGLPKSGTSYLQRLLSENKPALQEQAGILFPGRSWNDQVMAVRDVRDMGGAGQVQGAWQRMVDEIHRWHGRAVVSMEWLCSAEPRAVRRIATDLEPATVQVIVTVRDLGRTLPAAWQEFVQNRATWTWEEFLEGVTGPDPSATAAGSAFWSQQDAPRLVGRWASVVTPDQVHVVTVPQPGADRDLLWQRFAQVLGVDPAVVTTDLPPANESLGLESAELMRRVNARCQELGVGRPEYNKVFKHHLAKTVLAARRAEESALALPDRLTPWVQERAAEQRSALARSGARVVGDLDELQPVLIEGRQPPEVSDAEVLDAAVAAVVALAREQRRDSARGRGRRRGPRRRQRPSSNGSPAARLTRYGRRLARRVRARTSTSGGGA